MYGVDDGTAVINAKNATIKLTGEKSTGIFSKDDATAENSGTLDKDTINKWIIPFLSVGKRGFKSNFDLGLMFFDS